MINIGLPGGVGIDYVLPAYELNKYDNIEYNNEHHNLLRNGSIPTSKNHQFQY